MQTVSCPNCGAPVEFKSHASVVAVCGFCSTTVMKDADAVRDLGKMSAVLEDFTRIQIGTSGSAFGRPFTVVGRIQLKYSAGMWNEWFLLFDDAGTGWLGDSSGLYTLTTEIPAIGALPPFEDLAPGRQYTINGERFMAAEVRTAACVGGQGELPFKVGQGWQARVADFRRDAAFVTLDYSDAEEGEAATVYKGSAVTLEGLQCQLLRDDEQIKESTGRYRGRLTALECPSCGHGIQYLPGVTTSLVCPSCETVLDAAGPQAQILAKSVAVEGVRTSLPLGATARINNVEWQLVGAMRRNDDEYNSWTEYLLYNARGGFFWLVETPEGWSRSNVMPVWPDWEALGADRAMYEKAPYRKLYDYPATVRWAAGAFNWRVQAGDVVHVYEFENGQTRLAAERSGEELTWSRSTPVAYDQLRAWFGDVLKSPAPAASKPAATGLPMKFAMWILGLNAIPLLFNFSGTIFWVIIAIVAIFMSEKYFDTSS
jgi:ribosomal protein S27E